MHKWTMKYECIKMFFDGKHFTPQTERDANLLTNLFCSNRFGIDHYESVLEVVSNAGYWLETIDVQVKKNS